MSSVENWVTAFENQSDLSVWEGEGLGLFALGLRFGVEDLTLIASEAVTDGPDDKKIDLLYVDQTLRAAFIMQCYKAEGKFDEAAPSNKASDLNTAATYALTTALENVPDRLRPRVKELREAISEGKIDVIYFWYVHNRTEHSSVAQEISSVEDTARSHLARMFPESDIRVSAIEIGRTTFEKWYIQTTKRIIVSEELRFKSSGFYEVKANGWASIVTTIRGVDLYRFYQAHKNDLFSLNVRDYLGVVKKDANVNNNIKHTAANDAANFWAFNNGITGISNDFRYDECSKEVVLQGLSIVNGAQTTGAIGNLSQEPTYPLMIPARFFKTSNFSMIDNIVRFNNSQNAIEAADFRSTDQTQNRLRDEFTGRTDADYDGGRRGNVGDAISRSNKRLPNYTIGQVLTAFHGDPVLAYNEKSKIWIENDSYHKVFNDDTTASHIIFVFSLLKSVEEVKRSLNRKTRDPDSDISRTEQNRINYFRQPGASFLLIFIVSESIEIFLGRGLANKFKLRFSEAQLGTATELWRPIVDTTLAFAPKLTNGLSDGMKSLEKMRALSSEINQLIDATKESNEEKYKTFRGHVSTNSYTQ